jgi:hypothetical protein
MLLKTNQLNHFHKNKIIQILCESFDENQSVNFVAKPEHQQIKEVLISIMKKKPNWSKIS